MALTMEHKMTPNLSHVEVIPAGHRPMIAVLHNVAFFFILYSIFIQKNLFHFFLCEQHLPPSPHSLSCMNSPHLRYPVLPNTPSFTTPSFFSHAHQTPSPKKYIHTNEIWFCFSPSPSLHLCGWGSPGLLFIHPLMWPPAVATATGCMYTQVHTVAPGEKSRWERGWDAERWEGWDGVRGERGRKDEKRRAMERIQRGEQYWMHNGEIDKNK